MRKKTKRIKCMYCGKTFMQPRKESRFCSNKCSIKYLWEQEEYSELRFSIDNGIVLVEDVI